MGASLGRDGRQPVEAETPGPPDDPGSDSEPEITASVREARQLVLAECKFADTDEVQRLFALGECKPTREFATECLYTTCNTARNLDKPRLVRWLLDQGADPDGYLPDGYRGEYRMYPLMPACRVGELEIARLLLDRGADVNLGQGQRGGTALIDTCRQYNPRGGCQSHALVRLLLQRGADVHLMCSSNRTPLHEACSHWAGCLGDADKKVPLVRMLLEHGAGSDLYKKDCIVPMMGPHHRVPFNRGYYPEGYHNPGKTPLDYAHEQSNHRIKALLRKYLAITIRKYVIGPPAEHPSRRIEHQAPLIASFLI